jgi:uncharacterized protein (TIGR03382 family)
VPAHTLTFPGDFDFHFDSRLQADEQGIYLLAMRLTNPGGPLAPSETYYVVFNYGIDDSFHDAAIDYVAEHIIPAPGAAAAFGLGSLILARRRR